MYTVEFIPDSNDPTRPITYNYYQLKIEIYLLFLSPSLQNKGMGYSNIRVYVRVCVYVCVCLCDHRRHNLII